jgi:hypothetical protein
LLIELIDLNGFIENSVLYGSPLSLNSLSGLR